MKIAEGNSDQGPSLVFLQHPYFVFRYVFLLSLTELGYNRRIINLATVLLWNARSAQR